MDMNDKMHGVKADSLGFIPDSCKQTCRQQGVGSPYKSSKKTKVGLILTSTQNKIRLNNQQVIQRTEFLLLVLQILVQFKGMRVMLTVFAEFSMISIKPRNCS